MAQRTTSAIAQQIATLINDNGTGQVTASDVRSVLTDLNESLLNLSDFGSFYNRSASIQPVSLDTIVVPGFYYCDGDETNRPTTTNGHLVVIAVYSTIVKQLYYVYSSNQIYQRYKNTTWSDWVEFGFTDTIEVDVSGSTITFDLNGLHEISFVGASAIGAAKTWDFTNISNCRHIQFIRFTLSDSYVQTMSSNLKMPLSTFGWDDGTKEWTPISSGDYEMELTCDGTTLYVTRISGPY